MSEIKTLPLPKWCYADKHLHAGSAAIRKKVRSHASDVAKHNVAERDAEIEALREEKERWRILCNGESARRMDAEDRAKRLEEALHKLEDACGDSDGAQYGTLGTAFVRGICKDALHNHEQED